MPFASTADKAPGSSRQFEQRTDAHRGSGFRGILFTLLIGGGLGALVLWYIQGETQPRGGMLSSMQNPFKTEAPKPKSVQPAEATLPQGAGSQPVVMEDGKPKTMAAQAVRATEAQPLSSEPALAQSTRPAATQTPSSAVTTLQLPGSKNNPLKSREEKVGPKNLLSAVANRHYGAWNETVRDLIAAANPELDSLDNLPAGTKVQLPIFSRESLVVKDGQGRYYVFFGSFDKLEFARMNLDAIKRSFSGAELVPVNEQGVQLHRLFVGPFVSQGEAQAVANSLWFKYLPILN
ncbi:MAG: SPOR domain-containing protein [Betaproteobacteria bacterium]